MTTKDNTKELLAQIKDSDSKIILAGIESFRLSGNIGLLPQFIDIVLNNSNAEVVQKGTQVLYDIKDENAVKVIFSCLQDEKYASLKAQLTGVLWQAGMNCDDRLEDLVNVATQGDSNTALEVLTVIENIDASYTFDGITELKMNIVEVIEESDDQLKNQLLNSLCLVLEGMIE
jgi:hypothetical protein